MIRSANGRRILAALPRDRVVTETDGPYTTTNGHPSAPTDVPELIVGLARLWDSDATTVMRQVHRTMTVIHSRACPTIPSPMP